MGRSDGAAAAGALLDHPGLAQRSAGATPVRLSIAEQLDIAEFLTSLNSADDLESVLTITVQSAARLASATRSTLLLADEDGERFKLRATYDACGPERPRVVPFRGPMAPFASLGSLATVQPGSDIDRYVQALTDRNPWQESVVVVRQIQHDHRSLGTLVLEIPRAAEAESAPHRLVDLFLKNAGIAIDRARRMRGMVQKVDDLSALVTLGQAITFAPDFEGLLGYCVDHVRELARAEFGTVMLYQPDRAELVLQRPARGVSDELIRKCHQPPGRGLSGGVFLTGQPYLSNELEKVDTIHPHCFVRQLKCHNMLAVPLKVENHSLGVLLLHNRPGGDFTENDVRLVSLLASHIAVLIENGRLLESRRQTIAKLQEFNALIDRQREELRRTLAVHDEFTHMVLDGQGLRAVLATLSRLTTNPVVVEDRFGNVVGRHPESPGVCADEDWCMEATGGPVQKAGGRETSCARRPLRSPAGGSRETKLTQVVAPIVVGQETLGRVHVLESSRVLDALDFVTVERAAVAIALQMMREKAAAEAHYKLRSDLVSELVGGDYGPDDALLRRAGYLGIDLRIPRSVLAINVDDLTGLVSGKGAEDKILTVTSKLADAVERACKKVAPDAVVASKGTEIIVLATYTPASAQERRSGLHDLCDSIRESARSSLPGATVSVGVGSCCHCPSEYPRSYQQARSALEVIIASHQRDRTLAHDEIGIYGVLFDPHNRGKLASLVDVTLGPLLEYDRRHQGQLTETLDKYFLNDCHLERAATALHLHVGTLRYRLERIEQILGVDLRSMEARFRLQVALKMLHALNCR